MKKNLLIYLVVCGSKCHILSWQNLRHLMPIVLTTFIAMSAIAQTQYINLTGKVVDKESKSLRGVSVVVKGTSIGTQTDINGKFLLKVPSTAKYLIFSFLGMKSQEIAISGRRNLDVVLDDNLSNLADVVVVGYGKQKAVTVTGAISSVSGAELIKSPVANISNMLVGRVSGLSALQSGGEPGQDASGLHVRGVGTLNGSSPLIVIDGIQQPTENSLTVFNAMDPNEVQNITVLKDASATAVYGIRGANGVIIVTTKRGASGKLKVGFSANYGKIQAVSLLKTASSYEYGVLRNGAIQNLEATGDVSQHQYLFSPDQLWKFQNNRDYTPAEVEAMAQLTPAQKTQLNSSPALYYTSHDLFKEQFGGVGAQEQYNVNISGGNERIKYYTSVGYFSQGGIMNTVKYFNSNTGSTYKRYNLRSNFDINVVKNLDISIGIAAQSGIGNSVGSGNPGDLTARYKNLSEAIIEGNPFTGPGIYNGHLVNYFLGSAGSASNPLGLQGGPGWSPLGNNLRSSYVTSRTSTITSNVRVNHKMDYITKGLSSHVTFSYDDSYADGTSYSRSIPEYAAARDTKNPNNIIFEGGQLSPIYVGNNVSSTTWRKIYSEAALDYSRSFGSSQVTGLLLGNVQRYTEPYDNYNTSSSLMGFVGRATYNYKQRYLFEFNMGYNGTENFAPGRNFGFFPAASAGWIISEEHFFPKNDYLTFLKIRGSYGEVGNDQLSSRRYLYLPNTWAFSNSIEGNNGYHFGYTDGSSTSPYTYGARESAIGNPLITWERARKSDVAVETGFFKNRLTLNADWFNEKRDNILVTLQTVPSTFGVNAGQLPPVNVGKINNYGFEVTLGWKDKINDFSYGISGNFSYARNKIDYQAEALNKYPWMNATGYSIGQFKGLVSNGFYNTQAELNNRPNNTFTNTAFLGSIRYKDIDGDGKIDQSDMVPIGYSNLPRVAYNLTLNFAYKGFDISALFIGTAQGSFYQGGYGLAEPFASSSITWNALQWQAAGTWTPQRNAAGQKITFPSITYGKSTQDHTTSDFWLKSNSFTRLKNLDVGYTFKAELLRRTGIKSLRIFANGNNLFLWGSKLIKGVDPEVAQANGVDQGYLYPLSKVYNFGLNVNF